ncbi:MAG: hypothetical protein ACRDLV_14960 [Solirubrobacteraceae bacterium]
MRADAGRGGGAPAAHEHVDRIVTGVGADHPPEAGRGEMARRGSRASGEQGDRFRDQLDDRGVPDGVDAARLGDQAVAVGKPGDRA